MQSEVSTAPSTSPTSPTSKPPFLLSFLKCSFPLIVLVGVGLLIGSRTHDVLLFLQKVRESNQVGCFFILVAMFIPVGCLFLPSNLALLASGFF